MKKICTVVGARPQFIKLAVVSRVLRREFQEVLIHTGQHYDHNMSDVFFEEMEIPKPDYNLGISGGSHGQMTGQMLRSSFFLAREPGSGTRKRSEEFLRSIGVDPRDLSLAAQFQSTESILQGVKNGLGIAIVSGLAASDYVQMGAILSFDFDSPLLTRQFYLIHHRNRPHSPAAAMLLQELPRFFRDEPAGEAAGGEEKPEP